MRLMLLCWVALVACGPGSGGGGSEGSAADTSSTAHAMSVGESTLAPGTSAADTTGGELTSSIPLTTGAAETTAVGTMGGDTGNMPVDCHPWYQTDERGMPDSTQPSGFVECTTADGTFEGNYRVEAIACAYEHTYPPCPGGGIGECDEDAACANGESCLERSPGYCECIAPCTQDSDCPSGQICSCAASSDGNWLWYDNRCVPGNCAGDAACGDGHRCRVTYDICGSPESVWCTTEADTCAVRSDCRNGYGCRYDPVDELWSCEGSAICE